MTFAEEQKRFNKWFENLTDEERVWFSTAPEKLWKETLCNRCYKVKIKHSPHFDTAKASSYWCADCLPVVMEEQSRRADVVVTHEISRNQYDQQMAELQNHPAAHPNDCACDWCKPLAVARSATFTVAQASLAKPEKAQE